VPLGRAAGEHPEQFGLAAAQGTLDEDGPAGPVETIVEQLVKTVDVRVTFQQRSHSNS
jgi:hypothetical protein